jgi:hypothetical protein
MPNPEWWGKLVGKRLLILNLFTGLGIGENYHTP